MIKNNLPKVILIDWHRTLSFSQFWEHINQTNKKLFMDLEKCLFEDSKELINPWMTGKFTSEEICMVISKKLNLPFTYVYKAFVKSCKNMNLYNKDILEKIKSIKNKGVKFYIFTDNMDSFDKWTVPYMKLDKTFNGVINSNKIGFLKNDVDKDGKNLFLNNILDREHVDVSNIMLIDDNPNTIKNFSKYGLDCRLVTLKNNLEKILAQI